MLVSWGAPHRMLVRPHLPGYRWFHIFRNAAIRTGVYAGVCLSLVFSAWLVIANHAPFLERFAMERNIARMSGYIANTDVKIRPHVKLHKATPVLAHKQLEAPGAIGMALLFCASQVLKFCSDGFSDFAKAGLRAPQKYSSKSRLN